MTLRVVFADDNYQVREGVTALLAEVDGITDLNGDLEHGLSEGYIASQQHREVLATGRQHAHPGNAVRGSSR